MVTLEQTLRKLKIPVLYDGVVSLGETSLLLRAVRPFALKGDAKACELRDLLLQVRADGVITPEESERVRRLIEKITVDKDYHLTIVFYVAEDSFRERISEEKPLIQVDEAEHCIPAVAM